MQLNSNIPFNIGDTIQAIGYCNRYKVIDIISIYSHKNNKIEKTILKLKDTYTDIIMDFNYNEYKWIALINERRVV